MRTKVREAGLGLILLAPADLIIRKLPKFRVRQPERLFFSNAREGFDAAADPKRVQAANQAGTLAPDLVVEVLSPGQNERTLDPKLADYVSVRVEEVWFVDPESKSVRVLTLDGENSRLAGEFSGSDPVASAILSGIDVQVAAIFS